MNGARKEAFRKAVTLTRTQSYQFRIGTMQWFVGERTCIRKDVNAEEFFDELMRIKDKARSRGLVNMGNIYYDFEEDAIFYLHDLVKPPILYITELPP